MMPTEYMGFILTDDAFWQYRKKLDERRFLLIQANKMPDETYIAFASTVDLDEFSDKEIWEYVNGYYSSMEELEEACKDKDEMDGIIAECIFEQDDWPGSDEYWTVSNEEEAEKVILRFLSDRGNNYETAATLQAVLDDEKRLEETGDYYYEQYMSDGESPKKSFRRIISQYLQADDIGKNLIDDVLISLCGWSLRSLAEYSEGYNGDEEDSDESGPNKEEHENTAK
ncbi:MAG: hypothetical protein PHY15_06785 [Eubacteriales bacterium]|nr:hypothetical protein [Eubacteriales bacterium]